MKALALCLFAATCAALSARAAIVCVAPTATTAGSIQITAPIIFNIVTFGDVNDFALSNWVTSDGTRTYDTSSPALAYTLNGTVGSRTNEFVDNLTNSFVSFGPNDGYFLIGTGITVAPGDILALSAGTYILPAISGFNPQATQTFTGTLFVTDSVGRRLDAVPEPSTWALLGAAGRGRRGRTRLDPAPTPSAGLPRISPRAWKSGPRLVRNQRLLPQDQCPVCRD